MQGGKMQNVLHVGPYIVLGKYFVQVTETYVHVSGIPVQAIQILLLDLPPASGEYD